MMLLTKMITPLLGDSFLWKGFLAVIVGLATAAGYFLKTIYDLEHELSELKYMISKQEIVLNNSLQEIAQNQQKLIQQQLYTQQIEYNKVTQEWNNNLYYLIIGITIIGCGIGVFYFAPHILEYIWPTNGGNINVIDLVSRNQRLTAEQITYTSSNLANLIEKTVNNAIKQENKTHLLVNEIVLKQIEPTNNVGIELYRPDAEITFDFEL